jgi:hypothetical protein
VAEIQKPILISEWTDPADKSRESERPMSDSIQTEDVPVPLAGSVACGIFYQFYDIQGSPSRWAKKAENIRTKRYALGVTIRYPMRLYTRLKYGVPDIIRYEIEIARRLPDEIMPYLLQNMRLGRTADGSTVLCSDKVLNYDGGMSQTLNETGRVFNPSFWRHVEVICDVLKRHGAYLLGVFHGGNHVLVQKCSPDDWRPVLIDVVKCGRRLYPFQVNLTRPTAVRKKYYRQLERFKTRFRADQ